MDNPTSTSAPSAFAGMETPMTPEQELMYKRRWIALLLLSLSLVLIVADSTIVNIAFPSIRATFNASFPDAEWVNSIYSLVFGAALITWGKLGDQFGRRNIFVGGASIFLIGSLGSGLAPSIAAMIFFRAVQGLGAAMMSPSTLSIISSTFKGRERGAAFGIWGASAGMAVAVGPILAGWLITYGTSIVPDPWRLAFLINVPIGIVAIAGSFWAIRESKENKTKQRIDWLGILLVSLSLGLIVFGAIEGQNYGWLQAKKIFTLGPIVYPQLPAGVTAIPSGTTSFIPFAFIAGVIFLVLFVLIELRQERRGGQPLFEFGMLRYISFRWGLLTVMIVALGEFGVVLVLSIFLQLAKGLDAFSAGLSFLPFAITTLIAAPAAGMLSSRFGAKWVVTAGMLCESLAIFLISRVLYPTLTVAGLMPIFILYGAGVGLAVAQLANIVLTDIPSKKAGVASGATNTVRQLGASLGIALIGAVLFGTFSSAAQPLINQSTAFEDFGSRVAANTHLSPQAHALGAMIASYGPFVKQQIDAGLDANEGFTTVDVVSEALDNVPAPVLMLSGINLSQPGMREQLQAELRPDAAILQAQILAALADGYSTAGRAAATLASIFVAFGAIVSLLLPNTKGHAPTGAVIAH